MKITLRDATEADEPFLRVLYGSTRAEEVTAWGWPEAQLQKFLHMQYDAQRFSYRHAYPALTHSIVELDEVAIGRLMVDRLPTRMLLADISLLPEQRNRGLGSQLLRELQAECATANCPLQLQVLAANPARRLYERLGFVQLSTDSLYCRMQWNPTRTEKP